jgi:hypothetical protein
MTFYIIDEIFNTLIFSVCQNLCWWWTDVYRSIRFYNIISLIKYSILRSNSFYKVSIISILLCWILWNRMSRDRCLILNQYSLTVLFLHWKYRFTQQISDLIFFDTMSFFLFFFFLIDIKVYGDWQAERLKWQIRYP